MKKRKLLLLTAAILCLLMALTACGKEDPSGDSILDFFAPDVEPETLLSEVTHIDGKVVAYDEEHNLIAIEGQWSSDPEMKSIYVYNFSNGDIEQEYCYSTSAYSDDGTYRYSIELDYPMFCVTRTTYGTDSDQNPTETYEYTYFRLTENNDATSVASYIKEEDNRGFSVETVNGLYVCEVNGKVYWINSDLKVLREFNTISTEGYYLPEFYAEYKGYLYTHEFDMVSRRIQIFNKEGVCQVLYSHPNNAGLARVFVLNDGNVFIQEKLIVEDGEEYDLRQLSGGENGAEYVKLKVVSKILNFKTGEVTELDLDFQVDYLRSAYDMKSESYGETMIAETRNNVASITRFANGSLASVSSTVILDNEMNIEYTMPNVGINTKYTYIFENGNYIIGESLAGEDRFYLYDEYGKQLTTLPESFHPEGGVFGNYIVAGSVIYDYSMNKLYDLETSSVALNYNGDIQYLFTLGDKLAVVFYDRLIDSNVYYALDVEKKDLYALAPGNADDFWTYGDEDSAFFYFVYDEENKNETLYSLDGTALLRVQDAEWGECIEMNGIVILKAYVDGEDICYIVGEKEVEEG